MRTRPPWARLCRGRLELDAAAAAGFTRQVTSQPDAREGKPAAGSAVITVGLTGEVTAFRSGCEGVTFIR